MQTDEWQRKLAESCRIEPGQADQALQAFFQTLGEAVGYERAKHVAPQLPHPYREVLLDASRQERPHQADEFLVLVASRADQPAVASLAQNKVIWGLLEEALSESSLDFLATEEVAKVVTRLRT